jgi:hypothetical protein
MYNSIEMNVQFYEKWREKKQTSHIFQFTHGNICIEQLGITKYIVWFVKHGNAFDFLKSLFCLLFSFIFDTNFGKYSNLARDQFIYRGKLIQRNPAI